jgi:hypothetical protein
MRVGVEKLPDGWLCDVCDKCSGPAHTQQQMIASLKALGWEAYGGRDPATRQQLTLGQMFDRYSTTLCIIHEWDAGRKLYV